MLPKLQLKYPTIFAHLLRHDHAKLSSSPPGANPRNHTNTHAHLTDLSLIDRQPHASCTAHTIPGRSVGSVYIPPVQLRTAQFSSRLDRVRNVRITAGLPSIVLAACPTLCALPSPSQRRRRGTVCFRVFTCVRGRARVAFTSRSSQCVVCNCAVSCFTGARLLWATRNLEVPADRIDHTLGLSVVQFDGGDRVDPGSSPDFWWSLVLLCVDYLNLLCVCGAAVCDSKRRNAIWVCLAAQEIPSRVFVIANWTSVFELLGVWYCFHRWVASKYWKIVVRCVEWQLVISGKTRWLSGRNHFRLAFHDEFRWGSLMCKKCDFDL